MTTFSISHVFAKEHAQVLQPCAYGAVPLAALPGWDVLPQVLSDILIVELRAEGTFGLALLWWNDTERNRAARNRIDWMLFRKLHEPSRDAVDTGTPKVMPRNHASWMTALQGI